MDTDINKRYQHYLLLCWWEQWQFMLLGSYLNFCSKVVIECNGQGQGFIRDRDAILVLYELIF